MTTIEKRLNSMTGYATAIVYDTPNNRYNYVTGEIDCDDMLEADSIEMVNPKEESYVLSVMLDNWVAENAPAEGVQDDYFADCVKDVFFSEDSKMIIARKGDETAYVMVYE